MKEYDCLIIGYNDIPFDEYLDIHKSMGETHADFRDLNLNFVTIEGKNYRALDVLDKFFREGEMMDQDPFHNFDVLWMTITVLGSFLHKNNCSFDYVNLFQREKAELKRKLRENKYLTVAITTSIYNFDIPIVEIVNFIKEHNQDAKILIGGPYISKRYETMPREEVKLVYDYIGADFYIFSKEGEQSLVGIINALKENTELNQIPNIAYYADNKLQFTFEKKELNLLTENVTDYSLFKKDDFRGFVNVRLSKGCPLGCTFCGFPLRSDKYRKNDVNHVEEELNGILAHTNAEFLLFTDDTVNIPLDGFKNMLRMMVKNSYTFKWNCFFRADFCDEEVVNLMKQAGCIGVFFGLESIDDTLLANMNKRARREHYLEATRLFRKYDIAIFSSTFVGFPGETIDSLQSTLDFLAETEPDYYRMQLWWCDPQTPIYQQKEMYGLEGYHFGWKHHTMDSETACYLLEDSFLQLDVPAWVPDPGMNYTSVYYLLKRGMTHDQIKLFLSAFNTIVKEKLLFPYREEVSGDLIQNLRTACQFNKINELTREKTNKYPGIKYREAFKYYANEYSALLQRSKANKTFNPKSELTESEIVQVPIVNFSHIDKEELNDHIILAYFIILKDYLSEAMPFSWILPGRNEIVPLGMELEDNLSANEILPSIQTKMVKNREYQHYAYRIFSVPNFFQECRSGTYRMPSFLHIYNDGYDHIAEKKIRYCKEKESLQIVGEVKIGSEAIDLRISSNSTESNVIVKAFQKVLNDILNTPDKKIDFTPGRFNSSQGQDKIKTLLDNKEFAF